MLKNIYIQGVSVVIVCYNSANRIKPTLEHLALQEDIRFPWEVILVDNNSNDNTAAIAESHWKRFLTNVPLRLIHEANPGTMHARLAGIMSSNYRYILFCDDDNWLSKNYLSIAFCLIRQDENIAAIGGMGSMIFEKWFKPPVWVFQHEKSFGCGPQGLTDGDTTNDQGWLYTAGAILDKSWIARLLNSGFSHSLPGRSSKSLTAGEDVELTYALKLIGGQLHYSSKLTFEHFMPSQRINWWYLLRLWFAAGFVDFILMPYRAEFSKNNHVFYFRSVLSFFKHFILNLVRAGVSFFSAGNTDILRLVRYIGEAKASVTQTRAFFNTINTIRKLKAANQTDKSN